MNRLRIMSMSFAPNFLLSKQNIPGESEKMMRIASSYINVDESFDIILLQGKNVVSRKESLVKKQSYHIFSNSDGSSAILTSQKLPVLFSSEIRGLGNMIVVKDDFKRYLSIASVSLTRKKDLDLFIKKWDNFRNPILSTYIRDQIVGGLFPSKQVITTFSKGNNLLDASQCIQSTSEELQKDSYSILVSDSLELVEPQPHRQIGLVKKKYIKHCPIGVSVQTKIF